MSLSEKTMEFKKFGKSVFWIFSIVENGYKKEHLLEQFFEQISEAGEI